MINDIQINIDGDNMKVVGVDSAEKHRVEKQLGVLYCPAILEGRTKEVKDMTIKEMIEIMEGEG